MTQLTDLSKTIFYDNLYISSLASDNSVILSRRKDEKHPLGSSLSDMFDAKAQADIQKYAVSFSARPLLTASLTGPAIIFNFLYHSTLTLVTSFPEVDRDTALLYATETDSLIIADSLKDRIAYCEKNSDRTKYFILDRILQSTHTPLLKAATFIPLLSKDILGDMLTQAQMISEMCGCALEISKEGSLTRSSGERCAAEIDFPLYTAALTILLLLARRFSKDRSARIMLVTKEESPFVTVSFEPVKNELQSDNNRFTKELFEIRSVFQKLKALFYTADDGAVFSVCFSPVRTDWSLLGIKTPDGKLIYDVDLPLGDF